MADYVFGVDIGGTTVKMGLLTTDGTIVEKWEIPTRKENKGQIRGSRQGAAYLKAKAVIKIF